MPATKLIQYANDFFASLTVSGDSRHGTHFHDAVRGSVLAFLDDESKETAFDVYQCFFDTYRIQLEGASNPFVDLLDVLSAYEERAATLIDRQRDHYIHSVNVFVLGLCIYAQNQRYRAAFAATCMDPVKSPWNLPTATEEFFFRWGVAALFHDVGYPVEIITKQMLQFLAFATDADHDDSQGKIKAHLAFENFRRLNSIAEIVPKREFISEYYDQNEGSVYVDLLQPIDLLAHHLHLALGVPLATIKNKLDTFIHDMAQYGFVDHGFYSAIIVLKWYGYLFQVTGAEPMRFFHAIVDSASAILLHNYYRNVMQKFFGLGPLSAAQHPIAYLLILCDELQEWNREAYGIVDKKRTQAGAAKTRITDDSFSVTYLASKGTFPREFSREKKQLFYQLLDIPGIFPGGFTIRCDTLEEIMLEAKRDKLVPRPLLQNLEKLAKAIHDDYIQTRKQRHEPYYIAEKFEDLSPENRYDNLRQAKNMGQKLQALGYLIVPVSAPGEPVLAFDPNTIERYAVLAHDDWMQGKFKTGWRYTPIRNDANLEHNCLVPYADLSEEDKQKDRDTAENVFKLTKMIGLKVIRAE